MPSRSLFALTMLAGLAAVACDVNIHDGKASFAVFSASATDEWTHHYALAPGGRVEIVNVNGPVELTSGSGGGVDVHATITAKSLTDAGAREILGKGRIQEVAEAGRIHIETIVPRGVHGSYEVRYAVRLPADATTNVSTTNGDLKAVGLAGTLKATAVNGRVDFEDVAGPVDTVVVNGSMTVRLNQVVQPVRLEVTNGRIAFALPATSRANLSARVVNGGFSVVGLHTGDPVGRRIKSLEAALNGGGPEVVLHATNGQLSIEGR